MALQVQTAFLARDRAENQKQSLRLLDDVVQCCADASWIGELSKNLTALYVLLPESDVDRLVDALVAKSKQREAVAEALSRSAAAAKRSKRADASQRASALGEELQKSYADTDAAKRARGEETRSVGLSVGMLAPDFTTKDADGNEFKLSDYRGKVVVIDFWGFW
jgi:predicted phage gp36 major capsid-like protein